MTDSKIIDQPFAGRVNSFETHLNNIQSDARKVDPSAVIQPQSIADGLMPDYLSDLANSALDGTESLVKSSYIKKLLQTMRTHLLPTPAKVEKSPVEPTIAKAPIDRSLQTIGSRPVLERPTIPPAAGTNSLVAALTSSEGRKQINPAANNNEIPTGKKFGQIGEAELEKLTFDTHHSQIKIRQQASINLKDTILQESEEKKRLFATYLDLIEEARQKGANSRIFNWISTGVGIIGGAVCIGGLIALAIGTGGLAVPAILAIAGGIAGIAGGGALISGSIFKYQGNQATGDAFVAREKGNMKKDEIMAKLQDMETNDNSITQVWSSMAQLLRNTPSNMFR